MVSFYEFPIGTISKVKKIVLGLHHKDTLFLLMAANSFICYATMFLRPRAFTTRISTIYISKYQQFTINRQD